MESATNRRDAPGGARALWPALHAPRRSLGRSAAELRPLRLSGRGAPLYVYDEGRVAEPYGGNKVRKLELLFADAERLGVDDLVVSGAVGSHHVLATALYARRLGMRCFAVLFPQPDTPHVRQNARLIDAFCEGWTTVASPWLVPVGVAREVTALTLMSGRAPYVVPIGGSDALTTLGWMEAGFELADAVADGRLPRLDRVYVAVGSGGTAAGLLLGLRLAGCAAEVVGVRVVQRLFASEMRIRGLARGALRRLGRSAPLDGLRLVHDWYGRGYGAIDDRVRAVLVQGERLGVALEPTYTAKSLGGALEDHHWRPDNEVAVWVNTANAQPLDGLLREALPDVPARMRGLLRS
jgi:D-cysteine desulfhydrase